MFTNKDMQRYQSYIFNVDIKMRGINVKKYVNFWELEISDSVDAGSSE